MEKKKKIYLDNAATTAMYPEVIDAMVDAMRYQFGNPSSTHSFGQEAKNLIELARKDISNALGVAQSEIVFTSCGTEGNNLIIRSCVHHLKVKRIITSPLEHKCVLETVLEMKKLQPEVEVKLLSVNNFGDIDYQELEELLKENSKTTLVTLMHANNEIGNIYDIEKIGTLCRTYGAYFHSDTVQTVGHYPLDFSKLPIDFATASAHKFHGPKGSGFVYIRKSTGLRPLITGGGQERNMRSGTENVYGIVGMSKALKLSLKHLANHRLQIEDLKRKTIQLIASQLPEIAFNGRSADLDHSLYTILNLRIPVKNPLISFQLDLKGIAVSQGSACSSGAAKASLVMQTILTKEQLETSTPVRLSFSHWNHADEIKFLVDSLRELIAAKSVSV